MFSAQGVPGGLLEGGICINVLRFSGEKGAYSLPFKAGSLRRNCAKQPYLFP
jgi:hypothetical protein